MDSVNGSGYLFVLVKASFYTWLNRTLAALLCFSLPARADYHRLDESLADEVLSESVPTAFGQVAWTSADFSLKWIGEAPSGVTVRLGEKSFEWVRVSEVLVVPRAVLVADVVDVKGGSIQNAGFTQTLEMRPDGNGHLEIPVALISGPKNPAILRLLRNGQVVEGRLEIEFTPRSPRPDDQVFRDPSCSPFRLQTESTQGRPDVWAYVGCRLVYQEGSRYRIASLEMFVFWNGVGQTVEIDGVPTSSTSVSVWALRLRQRPGQITFKSGEHRIKIKYGVADQLHLVSFAAGVGPYAYTFDSPTSSVHSIVPLVTIYGSYFLTEKLRVVAFSAIPIASKSYTDFGVYLNSEYFRTFDLRLVLNVMLGGHLLIFPSDSGTAKNFGAPQGFELIYRDTFMKGFNLSAGAFIYPPIQDKAYYNAWVRYGNRGYFGEFNYLAWQEKVGGLNYYTRSMGVSVGFPLARFF